MLKKLKHFAYPYVAFLFVIGILVGVNELVGDSSNQENGTVLSATDSIYQEEVISPEELASNYQTKIKEIVTDLELLADPYSSNSQISVEIEQLNALQDRILELKVPEQYQELHLILFGITNDLKQIISEGINEISVSEVTEKLNNLNNQYAWL